jgi:hypothetical protein
VNPDQLTQALKKQRLQLKSASLRMQWIGHAGGLRPICHGVDQVGEGIRWLRGHPRVLVTTGVATGVALLVARPRALLRWAKRSFFAWQAWRKGRNWLARR